MGAWSWLRQHDQEASTYFLTRLTCRGSLEAPENPEGPGSPQHRAELPFLSMGALEIILPGDSQTHLGLIASGSPKEDFKNTDFWALPL